MRTNRYESILETDENPIYKTETFSEIRQQSLHLSKNCPYCYPVPMFASKSFSHSFNIIWVSNNYIILLITKTSVIVNHVFMRWIPLIDLRNQVGEIQSNKAVSIAPFFNQHTNDDKQQKEIGQIIIDISLATMICNSVVKDCAIS